MPNWVEQFEEHPIHQQLQAFADVLANLEEDAEQEPSPEVTVSIERLKHIANQTKKVLSTLDPFLTPMGVLNNINSHLQQSISHCNQYQSTKRPRQ